MKKETVIRQNRCDQEMNLFLFGCFFIFMAMQLFIGETPQQVKLVNGINMLLYLVFVPGFIFRLGYCFRRIVKNYPLEEGKSRVLKEAGKYLGCFFVTALLYVLIESDLTLNISQVLNDCLANTITCRNIPSVSAVFFAMALMLLIAWAFYESFISLTEKPKRALLVIMLCLLCAFLRTSGETYTIMAAFTGSEQQAAVPLIPYVAYFVLGMWFEERKPGFQWKIAAAALAVTGISLLLYRTPLQNLCRVTISVLPVYLIYAMSEGLNDLSIRFRPVRFVCETIELVFGVYALMLFALMFLGKVPEDNIKVTLLVAVGCVCLIYAAIVGFVVFRKVYVAGAERFETKIKHKKAVYFLVYTVAFAILLFLVFIDFIRFDKTLLWKADGISQYYPRAVFFIDYIRELFSNLISGSFELPMYDFRLGLGGEITYSLEPLYFLFALFGRENTEFAYSLLVLLRFYCAGIASSVMFFYFKKDYFTTFIASVVYVFCGFSLYGGARHPMFMVPMILLPLLVIAVEEIIRHKKWYLCTILVALSLFSNYYYLYMNTLGLVIYFFVRFFCQKEKEKRSFKSFMSYVGIVSGSYLLGVAMSCIVLVTTFGLYVGSGRSGAATIKTPSLFFYRADWLVRCFETFLTTANSPGDWLKLGFLPIAYLAVVFLFLRKGNKELKILSVIAAIMMALPVVGFVFSGFSAVSNRWCYMIALLVAYIVAECLPKMFRMDRREMKFCGAAVALYGFLTFFGNVMTTRYTKLAFVCLLVTFVIVLLCQESIRQWSKYTKQSMVVLLTFAMVLHSGHSLFSMSGVVREYAGPGETEKLSGNTPLLAIEELGDDSFYRVSTPKLNYRTISSSIIYDYNSISMFNSTFNGSIMEYLEKMGSTSYSVTQLFGMSNRAYMNALAAVKYYAYFDEADRALPYGYEEVLKTEVNGKETTVCENENALPLGYTYDSVISEETLESYDVLDRQEVMMQTAVVASGDMDGSVAEADLDDILVTKEEIEILSVEEDGIILTDTALIAGEAEENLAEEEADGDADNLSEEDVEDAVYQLTLTFESKPNSETYLVLEQGVLEGDMTEEAINIGFETEGNNLSYKFRSDDDRYGTNQEDYVFNLGYHEEAITTCTITMDRAGMIQFDSLKLYSLPMDNMEEYSDARKEDVLENVVIDTNQVSGTVNLEEDKLLVLSIPYQNGWTAYVDGVEVETVRTNYMYIGIPLTAGEHTIELDFAIPGVKYALVIMPSAVVLFIVLWTVSVIRRKRKKSGGGKKEK